MSVLRQQSERRQEMLTKINEIKANTPCADCGKYYHPVAMDFDHIGTNKTQDVSRIVRTGTWEDVVAEMAKCELVCSNCHRVRTYLRTQADVAQRQRQRA